MKRKVQLILMAILLPFLNGQTHAQPPSFSCGFDTLLHRQKQADPLLQHKLNAIDYGARRFREVNPDLQLYPKPQPAPACDICITIDPACFKTRYTLPVIVHIVHHAADPKGTGSNIPDAQVHQALATLNKRFAAYGENDQRAVNTGIHSLPNPSKRGASVLPTRFLRIATLPSPCGEGLG